MKKLTIAGALLLAGALGGCGGSSTSYSSPPAPMDTGPKVDAFYAEVGKSTGAMPENTEAASVDAVVLTAPEDSEPVAL
jgi:hypothetical protein